MSQIEEMVTSAIKTSSRSVSGGGGEVSGSGGDRVSERAGEANVDKQSVEQHGKAGTPTDVRDIHFWRQQPP